MLCHGRIIPVSIFKVPSPLERLCHNVILRLQPKNLHFQLVDSMRFFTEFILSKKRRFFAQPALSDKWRFFASLRMTQ